MEFLDVVNEQDKVEKVEFFDLGDIQQMIKAGKKFHPELRFLLNKHLF